MSLIHYFLIKTYGTKHVREVHQIYHTGMKYVFQWLKEDICKCIMIFYVYVICGEILLLLLQNADRLHQVEDYVRCSSSSSTGLDSKDIMSNVTVVLLLQTTDLLHQVEDYVIYCTWTIQKYENNLQKLIFNRGDINLESFNPATQNHWLPQPSLVRETRFLSLLSLTRTFFFLLENRIYLLKVQLNKLLKCQNKYFKVLEHNILKCQNTPFQIIRI